MLKIQKTYLVDEHKKPIAVQIPIEDFEKIEQILAHSWQNTIESSEESLLSVAGIFSGSHITSAEIEQELYDNINTI